MCVEAYAAGLLDGEGSIFVPLQRGGYLQLIVAFSMADSGPLYFLACNWGGNVTINQVTAKGRTMYHWQVSGLRALEFLRDVKPWVQGKPEQVELALGWPMCKSRNGQSLEDVADRVGVTEARQKVRDGLRELRAVR